MAKAVNEIQPVADVFELVHDLLKSDSASAVDQASILTELPFTESAAVADDEAWLLSKEVAEIVGAADAFAYAITSVSPFLLNSKMLNQTALNGES